MPKLDVENLFKHHPPTEDQARRYRRIRIAAKDFANVIAETVRESPEQTLAIRKVHEAMMQANAAIAVNE